MAFNWMIGLGMGVATVCAALGGLFLLAALKGPAYRPKSSVFQERQNGALFIFDAEVLIDSTPAARAILAASPAPGSAWQKLMAYLTPIFPEIDVYLADLAKSGTVSLASEDGSHQPILFLAEHRGGLTRITLIDNENSAQINGPDAMVHRALSDELALLRSMLAQAPVLAWREREDGAVIWANATYLLKAADLLPRGQDLSWPLPRLFERTASIQGAAGQRQKLRLPDEKVAWFDLVSVPDGTGHKVFALPADVAVTAETTLRDFMQTLAKTFAHLPVGLAIFDSQRQLQMFNPALLDLTGLPPDFLSLRPSLLSVLDALRDRKMVPEPKDYRSWRRQITEMERAAASGIYEETWNLPGGQTYRVIGRPHPNGALALMLEDISGEITRTRRYRADLELGQSVIDSMDEAVAVFSETGTLVMTNIAYAKLWSHDPSVNLSGDGIKALVKYWRTLAAPNPIWSEAEEFVCTIGDRETWSGEARLLDGRRVLCRFQPLSGGATLVGFRVGNSKEEPTPQLHDANRRRA
jgi:PAS domain-containing protein